MPGKPKPIEYVIDENGCHICTSHPAGVKKVNGKNMYIHQYVYKKEVGEIPEGMLVIRTCQNTKCINPAHLKLVTPEEFAKEYRAADLEKVWENKKPRPIEVKQEGDCLICTSHDRKVTLAEGGRYELVLHVYLELFEVPDGVIDSRKQVIARLCGNKHCINPEHLKLASLSDYHKGRVVSWVTREPRPIEHVVDENGCHICTSHKTDKSGYPMMNPRDGINERRIARYMYVKHHGPIPPGMVIRHKCDNRLCINPDHLEIGTQADNVRDMVERGRERHPVGEEHGKAVFTEEMVREIKLMLKQGVPQAEIARKFNVSKSTINHIKAGRTWRHIV